jgi:hypothetical protein
MGVDIAMAGPDNALRVFESFLNALQSRYRGYEASGEPNIINADGAHVIISQVVVVGQGSVENQARALYSKSVPVNQILG